MRTLKFCPLSNLQIHNTVSSLCHHAVYPTPGGIYCITLPACFPHHPPCLWRLPTYSLCLRAVHFVWSLHLSEIIQYLPLTSSACRSALGSIRVVAKGRSGGGGASLWKGQRVPPRCKQRGGRCWRSRAKRRPNRAALGSPYRFLSCLSFSSKEHLSSPPLFLFLTVHRYVRGLLGNHILKG